MKLFPWLSNLYLKLDKLHSWTILFGQKPSACLALQSERPVKATSSGKFLPSPQALQFVGLIFRHLVPPQHFPHNILSAPAGQPVLSPSTTVQRWVGWLVSIRGSWKFEVPSAVNSHFPFVCRIERIPEPLAFLSACSSGLRKLMKWAPLDRLPKQAATKSW